MEEGAIPDKQIQYSSQLDKKTTPGRLNGKPWVPAENDEEQYIEITLNAASYLTALAVQGADEENYVSAFTLEYRNVDSEEWQEVIEPGTDEPEVGLNCDMIKGNESNVGNIDFELRIWKKMTIFLNVLQLFLNFTK